jgi:hypothetical protein
MSEYTQYPDDVVMDTPIGQVKLAITDANHVSIQGEVVIRGKQVRAHLHVNDYGCGIGYEPSRDQSNPSNSYHALYATKVGTMGEHATDAQRKAILAAFVPAINEFMAKNPELRQAGADADKNNVANRIEEEIVELEKQLEAKKEELRKVHVSGRQSSGVVQFPCCKAYGVVNKNHVCPERMTFADEVIS